MNEMPEQDVVLTIELGHEVEVLVLRSQLPKWLEKREKKINYYLAHVDRVLTEELIREMFEYKIVKEEPYPPR